MAPNWQNSDDRLAAVVGGELDLRFTYDAAGRRTHRTVNGVETTSVLNGFDVVANVTGAARSDFLYGPGIDEPLAVWENDVLKYQLTDLHGSVVAEVEEGGTVSWSRRYDAWGEILEQRGQGNPLVGFTGRDEDVADTLQYYRTRYYLPRLGRFASEDGLRRLYSVSGGAVYGYARNAPTMYKDPFGLRWMCRAAPKRQWTEVADVRLEDWFEYEGFYKTYAPHEVLAASVRGRIVIKPGAPPTLYEVCVWGQYQALTAVNRHHVTLLVRCECPDATYEVGTKPWDSPRYNLTAPERVGKAITIGIWEQTECEVLD